MERALATLSSIIVVLCCADHPFQLPVVDLLFCFVFVWLVAGQRSACMAGLTTCTETPGSFGFHHKSRVQSLEDSKMIPRQDGKEVAVAKPVADVARGDAAANAGEAAEDERHARLRAAQWKCSWLELRISCAPPHRPVHACCLALCRHL